MFIKILYFYIKYNFIKIDDELKFNLFLNKIDNNSFLQFYVIFNR